MDRVRVTNKISITSIVINTLLSAFKFAAGVLAHSSAMVSDAVHSLSDVLSTFAVIAGVNLAEKKGDHEHPYGHERLESIFSQLLSLMLFLTAVSIGYSGVKSIINQSYTTPGALALVAAAVSVIVKEIMYRYTIVVAKKANSLALRADAWHHRTDALSSVGAFLGIMGAMVGYPICDSLVSILISLFIIKAAWDIFMDATNQLVDRSCDDETEHKILDTVSAQDGVISVDELKTRLFGSKMYVDVEIGADGSMTLFEAHKIAHSVHDAIENTFPNVKHCMVHVNPRDIS